MQVAPAYLTVKLIGQPNSASGNDVEYAQPSYPEDHSRVLAIIRPLANHVVKATGVIEKLLKGYNRIGSHGALRYRPPAPEGIMSVIMLMRIT